MAAHEDHSQPGEERRPGRGEQTEEQDGDQALEQGGPCGRGVGHRREGEDDHELREEQDRLDQDEPACVQPGLVGVEHVAGDEDVDVGERKEGEQGVGVVEGLGPQRPGAVIGGVLAGLARVSQGEPADQHREVGTQCDPEHRHELRGLPHDQRCADDEPRQTRSHVDQGQRNPSAFPLQDPRLRAHQGQRSRRDGDQRGRGETVQADHEVDDRGQDQAQRAHTQRCLDPDSQDHALDLVNMARCGRDPSRRGCLERQ